MSTESDSTNNRLGVPGSTSNVKQSDDKKNDASANIEVNGGSETADSEAVRVVITNIDDVMDKSVQESKEEGGDSSAISSEPQGQGDLVCQEATEKEIDLTDIPAEQDRSEESVNPDAQPEADPDAAVVLINYNENIGEDAPVDQSQDAETDELLPTPPKSPVDEAASTGTDNQTPLSGTLPDNVELPAPALVVVNVDSEDFQPDITDNNMSSSKIDKIGSGETTTKPDDVPSAIPDSQVTNICV